MKDKYIILLFPFLLVFSASSQNISRSIGNKSFEVSNHLNNISEVTSDRKIATSSGSVISYNEPDILGYTDYYPYGMTIGFRSYLNNYSYGYQGSEKNNGINNYTTYFRQLNSQLGRWLSVDPKKNPAESKYVSMANNPISFNDVLGDKIEFPENDKGKRKREIKRMVRRGLGRVEYRRLKRDRNNIYKFHFYDNRTRQTTSNNVRGGNNAPGLAVSRTPANLLDNNGRIDLNLATGRSQRRNGENVFTFSFTNIRNNNERIVPLPINNMNNNQVPLAPPPNQNNRRGTVSVRRNNQVQLNRVVSAGVSNLKYSNFNIIINGQTAANERLIISAGNLGNQNIPNVVFNGAVNGQQILNNLAFDLAQPTVNTNGKLQYQIINTAGQVLNSNIQIQIIGN